MKQKTLLALLLMAMLATGSRAQTRFDRVFNHVGAGIHAGTEGYGFDVATTLTPYLELSMGLNLMPSVSFTFDYSADISGTATFNHNGQTVTYPYNLFSADVTLKPDIQRTTADLKVNCYPFGRHSSFFIAAGLSFGGATIGKLKGHSGAVEQFMQGDLKLDGYTLTPEEQDMVKNAIKGEVDRYGFHFDRGGNVEAHIKANSVRPYLGLGFGRLVPRKRMAARVELGAQFMGKMKVYQDGKDVRLEDIDLPKNFEDDLSKIVDKLTVYPVLRLSLTGRII